EVKGSAPASELLSELAALRSLRARRLRDEDVRPHYAALAALCSRDGTSSSSVGDISLTELRRAFGTKPGLILTQGRWVIPAEALARKPIFAGLAPFVPASHRLGPLWEALRIGPPTVDDCIRVLQRLAESGKEPDQIVRSIIVDTLPYLRDQ